MENSRWTVATESLSLGKTRLVLASARVKLTVDHSLIIALRGKWSNLQVRDISYQNCAVFYKHGVELRELYPPCDAAVSSSRVGGSIDNSHLRPVEPPSSILKALDIPKKLGRIREVDSTDA